MARLDSNPRIPGPKPGALAAWLRAIMETSVRVELTLTELQSVAWPLGHEVLGEDGGIEYPHSSATPTRVGIACGTTTLPVAGLSLLFTVDPRALFWPSIFINWGDGGNSNPRPEEPQSSALTI